MLCGFCVPGSQSPFPPTSPHHLHVSGMSHVPWATGIRVASGWNSSSAMKMMCPFGAHAGVGIRNASPAVSATSVRITVLMSPPCPSMSGSRGSLAAVGHRVTLIPGDGIGPEVSSAMRSVVEATGVEIDWDVREAGAQVLEQEGTPLPDSVLEAIRDSRVAIKGPVSTPVGTGFRSVNVALRQELDLFAAVRPARAYPGVRTRHPGVEVVVIRENTEDLYQGIEFERGSQELDRLRRELEGLAGYRLPEDAGVTLKPISVTGTRRIVRFALEYARRHGRKKITVGHKANIMKFSDGVFLQTALGIAAAEYPEVEVEPMQVDELAMWLAWEPEVMDLLLLPNLYGDIVSDLCAGLVGGLGLAPGG